MCEQNGGPAAAANVLQTYASVGAFFDDIGVVCKTRVLQFFDPEY